MFCFCVLDDELHFAKRPREDRFLSNDCPVRVSDHSWGRGGQCVVLVVGVLGKMDDIIV